MSESWVRVILGWDTQQWGYAKARHALHGNTDISEDLPGMVELHRWWIERGWPDPLSVRFEGVVLEFDEGWAARAMSAAAMCCADNQWRF